MAYLLIAAATLATSPGWRAFSVALMVASVAARASSQRSAWGSTMSGLAARTSRKCSRSFGRSASLARSSRLLDCTQNRVPGTIFRASASK